MAVSSGKKWIIGVVGSLSACLLVLLLVPFFYRDKITSLVQTEFARHSDQVLQDFQADLSLLRNFPHLTLILRKVSVVDTSGAAPLQVLGIRQATITTNLLALLRKEVILRKADLQGVVFHQRVDATGRKISFQFKKPLQPDTLQPDTTQTLFLSLPRVDVRDARILTENLYKNNAFALHVAQARLGIALYGDSLVLQGALSGKIERIATKSRTWFQNKPFQATAQYTYHRRDKRGTFGQTSITINGGKLALRGSHVRLPASADKPDKEGSYLDIQLSGTQPLLAILQQAVPDSLRTYLTNVTSPAQVQIRYTISGESTPTRRPRNRLSFRVTNGRLHFQQSGLRITKFQVAGEIDNGEARTPQSNTLTIKQLYARTPSGEVRLQGKLTDFKEPKISGGINGRMALHELAALLHLPHLESYQGNAAFEATTSGHASASVQHYVQKKWRTTGWLRLQNAAFPVTGLPLWCTAVNGEAQFTNNRIQLNDLTGKVDGHGFRLRADVQDLFRHWLDNRQKVTIDGALHIKAVPLEWITRLAAKRKALQVKQAHATHLLEATEGQFAVSMDTLRLPVQEDLHTLALLLRKNGEAISLSDIRFQTTLGGKGAGNGGFRLVKQTMDAPFLNLNLNYDQVDLQGLALRIAALGKSPEQAADRKDRKIRRVKRRDNLPDNYQVNLRVNARKLTYEQLTGSNLRLRVKLQKGEAHLEQFAMNAFDGKFASRGLIRLNASGTGYPVQLRAQLQQMDLNQIFSLAEQLKLDVLQSRNIRGRINAGMVLQVELDQSFSPSLLKTVAYANARILDMELINVKPIQEALGFLREKRTEHLYFEDVETRFLLYKNRFITPGTNLNNNISDFDLSGTYTMGGEANLFMDVNVFSVLFGNNKRRIERIQNDSLSLKNSSSRQHLLVNREQNDYKVKLFKKKEREAIGQSLRDEFDLLLTEQKVDTNFVLLK